MRCHPATPGRALATALALFVAGCAATTTPTYARTVQPTSEGDLYVLARIASRQMACPEHALEVRALGGPAWQVAGCGQVRELALTHGRSGERSWRPVAPVRASAGPDLACPDDRIVVHQESAGVRNVSGCGRRARYQLACDARQCAWLMTEP